MVLSLAFILAFVGSAVALLIGIIIYSEVQDDLANSFAFTPEVIIPESTQNFAQNSASGDQPISADKTNLASVYVGLGDTDLVTEVTIPISSVNAQSTTPFEVGGDTSNGQKSNEQNIVSSLQDVGGLTVGDKITDVNIAYGSRLFGAETGQKVSIALFTTKSGADQTSPNISCGVGFASGVRDCAFLAQSDIVNLSALSPQGTCSGFNPITCQVDFTFNPPYTLVETDGCTVASCSVKVLINAESGSRHQWGGVSTGTQYRQLVEFEDNGSCVIGGASTCIPFFQFPLKFDGDLQQATGRIVINHLKMLSVSAGGALPIPYQVGLFDSSNNALSIQSGEVTVLGSQDLVVSFPSVAIPNGQVSVGVFGENINYLGDTTTADFSNDGATIVSKGTGTFPTSENTVMRNMAQQWTEYDLVSVSEGEEIISVTLRYDTDNHTQGTIANAHVSIYDQDRNLLQRSITESNIPVNAGVVSVVYTFSPALIVGSGVTGITFTANHSDQAKVFSRSNTGTDIFFDAQGFGSSEDPLPTGTLETFLTVGTDRQIEVNYSIKGVGGMEDPFVSDGTNPSSQRTIIEVVTPQEIISATGGANDAFIQANNVALTVIAILPVALFFVLFSIFSGRFGE